MSQEEMFEKVGAIRFKPSDLGFEICILDYLRELLIALCNQKSKFSGKRPFGFADWMSDIEAALVKSGFITGGLDECGYVEWVQDPDDIDEMMCGLVNHIFDKAKQHHS